VLLMLRFRRGVQLLGYKQTNNQNKPGDTSLSARFPDKKKGGRRQ